MIKCENESVEMHGLGKELVDDFTRLIIGFKELLGEKAVYELFLAAIALSKDDVTVIKNLTKVELALGQSNREGKNG
jgi:hypothetical protein